VDYADLDYSIVTAREESSCLKVDNGKTTLHPIWQNIGYIRASGDDGVPSEDVPHDRIVLVEFASSRLILKGHRDHLSTGTTSQIARDVTSQTFDTQTRDPQPLRGFSGIERIRCTTRV
jgi:hypothetical protein